MCHGMGSQQYNSTYVLQCEFLNEPQQGNMKMTCSLDLLASSGWEVVFFIELFQATGWKNERYYTTLKETLLHSNITVIQDKCPSQQLFTGKSQQS